jgi:hypothetical protein
MVYGKENIMNLRFSAFISVPILKATSLLEIIQ